MTNNGRPAAVIGPPPDDTLSVLAGRGLVHRARRDPATLPAVTRRRSGATTAEIVADVRGRW
ncbi:MAG: hypothetical protein QM733_09930 [Ilumatobacteraceae bacterium]